MATEGEIEVAEKEIQVENHEEIGSVELPAPDGWKKKFIPMKGGTPKRNKIVFISPTGEEIKHKRQLDVYLKAHPGGPPSSEFDWGTGDTPRRSARISDKSKATETPENEPVKKRERKSSSKKGAKEDGDDGDGEASKEDGDGEASKEEQADAAVDESKAGPDVEMKEAENGEDKTVDEATIGEAVAVQKDVGDKSVDAEDKNKDAMEENDTEKVVKPAETNSKIDSDSKGTGDTPRRSARINEKSKATETPENEPVKKRERKSSSKKGAKEDGDDGDGEASKEEQADVAVDESKAGPDVEMKEAENGEDKTVDEATIGEAVAVQKDVGDKSVDAEDKNKDAMEENDTEKVVKPAEANSKIDSDSKGEQIENNSLPPPTTADCNKESEAPPPLSGSNEVEASAEKETEVAVGSSENDGKLGDATSSEKEVKTGEVLPDNSSHIEIQAEAKPLETNSVN